MFAGWRAGNERAQRPVRHRGESERRNADAGQGKGGEKGKQQRGLMPAGKNAEERKGRAEDRTCWSGIPA